MRRRVAAANASAVSRRDTLFNEIVEARGQNALSTVDLACARRVAALLASETLSPSDSAVAAQLLGMLPQPLPKEDAPPNWDRLTDAEFNTLETLCAKLRGEAPPAPIKRRRVQPERWRILRGVCLFLDQKQREGRPLTDAERHELRQMIRDALQPVIAFELLWSSLEATLRPPVSAPAAAAADGRPVVLPPPQEPPASNVTRLRPPSLHRESAPQ